MIRPSSLADRRGGRGHRGIPLLVAAAAACSDGRVVGPPPVLPAPPLPPAPPASAFLASDVVYTVTVLPTLGGATATVAAINAQGMVVGSATDASGTAYPVVWRGGTVVRLDADPVRGGATAINARGDVAGNVATASGSITARLWLADGRVRTPAIRVPITLGAGAATVACCTGIVRLNDRLQALATAGPPRSVADTTRIVGGAPTVLVDFGVDTASIAACCAPVKTLSGLNNAGHAVGSGFEVESQLPVYFGAPAPTGFEPLPDGAPRCSSCGHFHHSAAFIDDADRIYGEVEGATYVAPAGGRGTWLYPYIGNATLAAVSGGGMVAAGPTTEACTAVGAERCVRAGTLFLWRATDRAVLRVVLPAGWTITYVTGVNDAGQIVGMGSDGTRRAAILLTPATHLPR